METSASSISGSRPVGWLPPVEPLHTDASGVSWAAVGGGAIVTATLELILLALGAGLGLSAISPWSGLGASTTVIGASVIIWYIIMQVVAGSMGGYLAGRLRSKWAGIHNDEVYFRDTAHGLMAWGLAFVVTVGFLATAATVLTGATVIKPATQGAESQATDPNAYYVDMLFRVPAPVAVDSTGMKVMHGPADPAIRGEAARIFAKAVATPDMAPADRAYLAQVIADRTGITPVEADKRVTDVVTSARQTADDVRKAAAHSLLWIFAALLIGAFCASLAATIGGRQRDNVVLL